MLGVQLKYWLFSNRMTPWSVTLLTGSRPSSCSCSPVFDAKDQVQMGLRSEKSLKIFINYVLQPHVACRFDHLCGFGCWLCMLMILYITFCAKLCGVCKKNTKEFDALIHDMLLHTTFYDNAKMLCNNSFEAFTDIQQCRNSIACKLTKFFGYRTCSTVQILHSRSTQSTHQALQRNQGWRESFESATCIHKVRSVVVKWIFQLSICLQFAVDSSWGQSRCTLYSIENEYSYRLQIGMRITSYPLIVCKNLIQGICHLCIT